MTKVKTKVIKDIFEGILSGISKKTLEKYPELIKSLKEIESPEDFNLSFMYPVGNCLSESIKLKIAVNKSPSVRDAQSKIYFIYLNYDFVKAHIEKIVIALEGTACSADKSRYILNAYEKYYAEGKSLGLPRSKKDDKGGCYWKPRFWNDKKWLEYLDVLVSLYYGDFVKYGKFIKVNYLPLIKKEK